MSELRQKIESTEPALRVEFLGILSDLIGDLASSPSPVEIRLYSEDTAALHRTAKQIAESIGKVKGVVEIFNGIVVSGPAVTFRIDPQRAAMFGVTTADITATIEAALGRHGGVDDHRAQPADQRPRSSSGGLPHFTRSVAVVARALAGDQRLRPPRSGVDDRIRPRADRDAPRRTAAVDRRHRRDSKAPTSAPRSTRSARSSRKTFIFPPA